MNFTPSELKHIQRLRKQARHWKWTRWIVLGMGIMSAALCVDFGYFLRLLMGDSSRPLTSEDAFIFAFYWTKCCMYFVVSIWLLSPPLPNGMEILAGHSH